MEKGTRFWAGAEEVGRWKIIMALLLKMKLMSKRILVVILRAARIRKGKSWMPQQASRRSPNRLRLFNSQGLPHLLTYFGAFAMMPNIKEYQVFYYFSA